MLAHKVVDIYLEDKIKEPEDKPEVTPSKEKTDSDKDILVDPALLNTYVGEYELQPGFIITITVEEGRLYGLGTDEPKFLLIPVSNTEFEVRGVEATITFLADGAEQVEVIKLSQGGQFMEAGRHSLLQCLSDRP